MNEIMDKELFKLGSFSVTPALLLAVYGGYQWLIKEDRSTLNTVLLAVGAYFYFA